MEYVQETKQRDFDDFTYIPDMIFRTLGIDLLNKPKPLWKRIVMGIYASICFCSHWYIVYYLVLRTIEWQDLSGNPIAIMRFGIVYFFVANSDVKFLIILYYRRPLRHLNDRLKALYPQDEAERRAHRVNEFFWPSTAKYGFYYYYFVVVFVVIGPITQGAIIYLYQRYAIGAEATFPFLSTFPMRRIEPMTPWTYVFSQLVDVTFSHLIMNINLGTDIWMMCHSAQLCMHFAHLGRQLKDYTPSRLREQEDCIFLASLIRKHQVLFGLHMELNEIFGIMLAYNLFSTASTLCCVIFYTMLQGFNREGIGFLLFFFSSSAQFYMVSYYGQLLNDWSEKVALSAYTQNWYNASIRYRKHLLLIMKRAQRPANLSARGVIIISLDTFKRMIRITYQTFAVVSRLLGK